MCYKKSWFLLLRVVSLANWSIWIHIWSLFKTCKFMNQEIALSEDIHTPNSKFRCVVHSNPIHQKNHGRSFLHVEWWLVTCTFTDSSIQRTSNKQAIWDVWLPNMTQDIKQAIFFLNNASKQYEIRHQAIWI